MKTLLALLLLFVVGDIHAQTLKACAQYRQTITRNAYRVFGPGAPVATLVAQLHQESGCNVSARSRVGALGMGQFMPATAADMAKRHAAECAPVNPFSADWAIRCRDRYMADLLRPYEPAHTESDQMAFGLSAYNGGGTWVKRDQAQCRIASPEQFPEKPCYEWQWWGNVELTPDRRRAPHNVKENRDYPKRIMCEIAPRYVAEGWGRAVECPK